MRSFKKIVVAVDFSRHSQEATRVAVDLAARYQATVKLVHVYQPVDYGLPEGFMSYTPIQLNELIAALEKHLEASEKQAQAMASGVPVSSVLLHGAISSEIVRFAKDEEYDLIVMGTHGRTGLGHVMLGSVAEKVLRTAPCPVLTVRAS
jgi:nucleotide-binding universal stress UspA family protein